MSYSLNKKTIRNFLDYDNVAILNGAVVGDGTRCGISPLFDLFNVRRTPVTEQLSVSLPHLGVEQEWQRLVPLFTAYGGPILNKTQQRQWLLSENEVKLKTMLQTPMTTNLIDVFGVIGRGYFPSMWRFVVRVLTIMPTTVACEQSFSYFKRT